MKRSILPITIAAALFCAAPVYAQQAASAPKADAAKSKAATVEDFDKQATQVQEHIKTMHEQMDKISKTQDPKERQKLLQEHWATMQGGMGMMRGMWGPGMMGGPGMHGNMMGGPGMGGAMMGGGRMQGWHGMGGYYSKLTPEQMKQRQYMMDQYMGMQQQMMDNMMQHQQYMWAPPAK
jgi:hypothetical protein